VVAKLGMNLTSEDTALCAVRFLDTSGDSANQHHPTLDSTSDLTHPGGGAEVCMEHISVMRWAFEVGKGWFLSQFLMGSVVVFDFKTPFARLVGQNP
jgi:hypothetical protein